LYETIEIAGETLGGILTIYTLVGMVITGIDGGNIVFGPIVITFIDGGIYTVVALGENDITEVAGETELGNTTVAGDVGITI